MSNSFIMTESIVRPAKMPYGRLKDNGFVGIEGEHAARALVVETKDDLSAFASINLIIDDLDCGAMTKTTSGSTTTLSMTLTSSMIGRSGRKICQLIMVNSGNTVVQKSSQFEAYVGRANEIERSVDDGVTIIILSEAVTEMAREAAAAAAEEAVADVVEDCQAIADAASASADAAAQSASDAQTAAASITVDATLDPTSTHAIQNKAVASEIAGLKADLGALETLPNDVKTVDTKTKIISVGVDSAEVQLIHSQPEKDSLNLTWIDDDTFTVNGSVTAPSGEFSYLNLRGSTSSMSNVPLGETYTLKVESDSEYITPNIWVKHVDDTTETVSGVGAVSYKPLADDKGLIFRIRIRAGVQITATCNVKLVQNITPLVSDTSIGVTGITNRLSAFGRCMLGKGIFSVSSTITMPSNSLIEGYGKDTVIRYTGTGTCLLMGARCSVRNLTIQGSDTDITLPGIDDDVSNKHAIEWAGETVAFGVVDSCIIERFDGSAIYAHDTGTPLDRNLLISNCILRNNGLGVYIRKDSEFIKIVNCAIVRNTYGILNRGGNNIVDNCGVDGNAVGIRVDADEGHNNGHGNISNCTINHSGDNEGYGLIIDGTGRMIVSNCNFYYSKIRLENGSGNIINGCGLGNQAIIEINEGSSSMTDIICNCMMRSTENVINVYRGLAKVSNCWTRAGQAVEATPVSA